MHMHGKRERERGVTSDILSSLKKSPIPPMERKMPGKAITRLMAESKG